MVENNFQRIGALANSQVGRDFESVAKEYFKQQNLLLQSNFAIEVGAGQYKKRRNFDLGSREDRILVECKSHRWTTGNNVPSAKITVWNEAMYYFFLAPQEYRKILFVLHDFNSKHGKTLAQYYLDNYGHLIPDRVEIIEYDEVRCSVKTLKS